ncbi:17292_t:CDS:2, partial [Cetraspora pellucida]
MGCFVSKKKGLIDDTLETYRDEKFPFPKNNHNWDRLTLQHYLFRYIWQSNFSSPIDEYIKTDGIKVLDVGSGSGPWALEMAGEYPNALFTKIDSNTSLQNGTTLPNFTIKDHNLSKLGPLPFEDSTFEFIHVGFLSWELTENQFETLINELVRILKPGGYLEIMDVDCQGGNEGPSAQLRSYYSSKGINPLITSKLESIMNSTKCLSNVTVQKILHPLGNWEDKIGEIALLNLLQFFNDFKSIIIPFMGISDLEYRHLIQEFK